MATAASSICCPTWRSVRDGDVAELNYAAGNVGVVGHECSKSSAGCQHVEQAARDAPVKRTDDRLALTCHIAVGAVAKVVGQPAVSAPRHRGLVAECGKRGLKRLGFADCPAGCQLPADLTPGGLDTALPAAAGADRACQPTAEIMVCVRSLAGWAGARSDCPEVTRSPACGARSRAGDEARLLQSSQVHAHSIWM